VIQIYRKKKAEEGSNLKIGGCEDASYMVPVVTKGVGLLKEFQRMFSVSVECLRHITTELFRNAYRDMTDSQIIV
jgi:hypothetical protein